MPDEHGGNSGRQLMFLAPRSEWEMVEGSWGDLLGLKGSGSHTLRFDHGRVPSHAVLEDTIMVDVEVEDRQRPRRRAPRQPDVRRAHDGPLHHHARGGHGRRRVQRARRVRASAAREVDGATAVRAAPRGPRLPAVLRRGAREDRDGRGRAAAGVRAAHGALPPRRRGGRARTRSATTCSSAASRAR